VDYDKLWVYVSSFTPATVVEEDGNPMYDSEGNLIIQPRYINMKDLVTSTNPKDFLCSILSSFLTVVHVIYLRSLCPHENG